MKKTHLKFFFVAALVLVLNACAPGTAWNPLRASNGGSIGVKANESTHINLDFSASDASALLDSPARLYARRNNSISIQGTNGGYDDQSLHVVFSNVPNNWKVSAWATVYFSANSSSAVWNESIQTQTLVTFSGFSVGLEVELPAGATGQKLIGQVIGTKGTRNISVFVEPR